MITQDDHMKLKEWMAKNLDTNGKKFTLRSFAYSLNNTESMKKENHTVSAQTISNWVDGSSSPRRGSMLRGLRELTGKNPYDLLGLEDR